MALVAKLFSNVRAAERYSVSIDGTLRNARAEPQDVVIDDLSATGFRTNAGLNVAVDDEITLGVFGVGLRAARVLRACDDGFGCQFLVPLNQSELASALGGLTPPEPIRLPVANLTRAVGAGAVVEAEWSLSPRLRVATIVAVGVVPWLVLGFAWASFA